MSLEWWKLVIAFVSAVMSGVLVHIAKDAFAESRTLKQKRAALWKACAIESAWSEEALAGIEWSRDRTRELKTLGSSPLMPSLSAELARPLATLDPSNIEIYAELILAESHAQHRGRMVHAELERFGRLASSEERRLTVGLVDAELAALARTTVALAKAHLKVMRVLRDSVQPDEAVKPLQATETACSAMEERVDRWDQEYAALIGQEPDSLRPSKMD
ncbi:MAG TPA: hypothetical protein VK745_15065 [Polyangiaceae bacterium]|jgi:hypothetical protein|nr:hypothetical protein [Polyangiaceae bacterium]